MAFHCGVLRGLAETDRLEDIAHVSSVSGGTLITGLILACNGWRWPTSKQFLESVVPNIKRTLTTKNVSVLAAALLFLPKNWRYLFSRANILAQGIEICWDIHGVLADLPDEPIWTINGTTAETGRRFRFKSKRLGDYELGYAKASHFGIAQAMAISAAVPGAIGPLVIGTKDFKWMKRPVWGNAIQEESIIPSHQQIHIYDGGIYDNLGLEPLIDVGLQQLKEGIDYIVCSDASGLLKREFPDPWWSPFRAMRMLYIVMDQARALRVRALVNFLKNNPQTGIFAQIGADPGERARRAEFPRSGKLANYNWLTSTQVKKAAEHPTSLRKLSEEQFVCLERHGYESFLWAEATSGGPQNEG